MEILLTLGIGAAGGLIVLFFEYVFLHLKDKRINNRQRLIAFPSSERIIDDTIFTHLRHGASIELMKSVLGTANKVSKYDVPVFSTSSFESGLDEDGSEKQPKGYEEGLGVPTHSYLYNFKNADIKITSKDNETIDSLTVVSLDENLRFGYLIFPWNEDENLKFGQAKVTAEMIESCRAEYIKTRWDDKFVLSLYIGSPTYDYVTYFGTTNYEEGLIEDKKHSENFIGGTIDGVCLSQTDTDVYYIYFSELR